MEEGEEERATAVPNREGKESVDGCQFATVHEGAPRPTRRFENTPTLASSH